MVFSPFQSINVGKIGSFALAEIDVTLKQICPIIDKMYERLQKFVRSDFLLNFSGFNDHGWTSGRIYFPMAF